MRMTQTADMPTALHPSRWPRRWPLWIALGFILRLFFIWSPRTIDDDTWDYLELGRNLLHHWVYGLGSGNDLSPSLFRLPAYPIILAVFHQLFGNLPHSGWLVTLYLFQSIVDLVGCLLLAAFAYRCISPRAGEIALALAALCPFTAAEAGTAMTECLSIFAVSLGIYAAGRILSAEAAGLHDTPAVIYAGCASGLAMLLRPDGALLPIALAAGLFFYILRSHAGQDMRLVLRRSLTTTSILLPRRPGSHCRVDAAQLGYLPCLSAAGSALSRRPRRSPQRWRLSLDSHLVRRVLIDGSGFLASRRRPHRSRRFA